MAHHNNLTMAEAFLAVTNVLNDVDVTAWGINVENHGRGVDVHVDDCNAGAVDTIAGHLKLAPDDERSENYTRTGDVTVYGLPLSVTVFCGRPEPVRVASVALSKGVTA